MSNGDINQLIRKRNIFYNTIRYKKHDRSSCGTKDTHMMHKKRKKIH